MGFRQFLLLTSIATACAWIAWCTVLFAMDPTRAGGLAYFLFSLTLFASVFGTFLLVGVAVRRLRHPQEIMSRHVTRACRQAVLLAALLVGSLLLLSKGVFTILTMLLFVFFLAALELAFFSNDHQRQRAVRIKQDLPQDVP